MNNRTNIYESARLLSDRINIQIARLQQLKRAPLMRVLFMLLALGLSAGTVSQQSLVGASETVSVEMHNGISMNETQVGLQADSIPNQVEATGFQPTRSSIYTTFYYPWYGNPTTDPGWASWNGSGAKPPTNWASNYLPLPPNAMNLTTRAINPSVGLYSSADRSVFYWQISQMAQAHLEVAISSWWGRSASPTSFNPGLYSTNGRADYSFRQIITNWMNHTDNPYPNLRWSLYYEKEGFSDPSVAELVSDMQYIRDNYINQPGFLKVGGRPVLFVYGQSTDGCAMAQRWLQARAQSGVNFYLVLKLYSSYKNCTTPPDSWHQYAPAVRAGNYAPYASFISPGFWKKGSAVTLARDLAAFDTAAVAMVQAATRWKMVQTWNEWGEGTSIEPGIQVQLTASGTAIVSTNAVPFESNYINILAKRLPALQAGTGR